MLRLAAAFVLFAAPAMAEVTRADCIALIQGAADAASSNMVVAGRLALIQSEDDSVTPALQAALVAQDAVRGHLEAVIAYCTAKFSS